MGLYVVCFWLIMLNAYAGNSHLNENTAPGNDYV